MHIVNIIWETYLIPGRIQDSGYTTVNKTKLSPMWFDDQFTLVCPDFSGFSSGHPVAQKPFNSRQTRMVGHPPPTKLIIW